ncbi:hypothetical protein V492_00266 [Pseudogymnoascus sp. VKM F-4246]|nr:hypothetical protein V492_00266 [Pseudogymnoascus sp. VKM F-4246]
MTAAFDDLLDIPGLWGGMKITTLHKMMDLKCGTELLHYLRRIKQVWSDLVHGNKAAMGKIDQTTAAGMGDGGQPEQPTNSSTPAEDKREGAAREGEVGEGAAGEGATGEREIDINLIRWEDDTWKYLKPLAVDLENPSNIERTHTILLIAEDELAINDRMHESAANLHTEATKRVIGLKRKATEDLSHTYHVQKMVVCTDGNELP